MWNPVLCHPWSSAMMKIRWGRESPAATAASASTNARRRMRCGVTDRASMPYSVATYRL